MAHAHSWRGGPSHRPARSQGSFFSKDLRQNWREGGLGNGGEKVFLRKKLRRSKEFCQLGHTKGLELQIHSSLPDRAIVFLLD